MSQVNLIYIELEDLLFREAVLDLEGEQRFVELACKRLLRRQEEVARHLHGDGARALSPPARYEIGPSRAHHADIIDAGVLVEALVLGGDHRVLELLRSVGDRDYGPALLAELADQDALRGIDPKRDLRLVGG